MFPVVLVLALAAEAPAEVHRILPLLMRDQVGAWATPISPVHLVTAGHAVERPEAIRVRVDPRTERPIQRLWVKEDTDLSLVMLDGATVFPVKLCEREAEIGERVWYRILLAQRTLSYTFGHVLGQDGKYLLVRGWAHPGFSGSGVLSDEGCLLGVATGGANWAGAPGDASNAYEMLLEINRKAHFSPAITVTPLKGWPNK